MRVRPLSWKARLALGTALACVGAGSSIAQEAGTAGYSRYDVRPPVLAQEDEGFISEAARLLRRRREVPADPQYTPATESDAALETERYNQMIGGTTGETEPGADGAAADGTVRPPRLGGLRMSDAEDSGDAPADAEDETGATAKKPTTMAKPGTKTKTAATGTKTASTAKVDTQKTGDIVLRNGQSAGMVRAQRAQAADPVQSRDVKEEENPYEAVGLRFGSITLRPAIEQGIEVTSTRGGGAAASSTTSSVTTLRGDFESDWRAGSLEGSGFFTARQPLNGTGTYDPEAGVNLRLTHPIGQDWQAEGTAAWSYKRESASGSAALLTPVPGPTPVTIIDRAYANSLALTAGVSRSSGFLRPGFKLEIDRNTFTDATDSLGNVLPGAERDETLLRGTARLGFEVSPALIPFVELAYGRRTRDVEVDSLGLRRSGDETRATVGLAFNPSEKFNGEVSVGWLRQTFDDATLSDVDAIALAAALNWSPQRGTVITAGLTTNVDGGNGGSGASTTYAGTLGLTHQFAANFSATGTLGASLKDYAATGETDTTLSAEAVATWWWNRSLGLNARARYETVASPDPLRESDTTTLLLGLRLQH